MPEAINPFLVPESPDALLPWLEEKRTAGKIPVPDTQLRNNLAFVLGHQWIVWDQQNGRYQRANTNRKDPNAPVRITANKIGSLVERAIAKLTRSAPLPEARPVSDSEDDISTAKVSTRIMDHEMYRMDWDSFLTAFMFWPATLGWSYTHIYWDPKKGAVAGSMELDGETQTAYQGDVCIEEVPAWELRVDPNSKRDTLEDARWAVRSTVMTKEAVWERWGKRPEGGEPGRSLADDVHALASDSGTPGNTKDASSTVLVHQFWMRPGSRASAKGMVVTWTGKTLLEGPMPFPYTHGRLPFVQWNLLPGLGTREGRTWVSDLIPLQVDYNDARSREATIRRMLTPKVLAPTGSIDTRRLTSRVEVIDYAPTGPAPSMMIPDSGWMNQYEAGMARADGEMGDRAGQQDVSAGKAPSASMPAAAILALQEADDTRLAISAKELAKGIRQTGWHILQLVRQYWTEERVVRTWSEDGDLEVQRFTGAEVAESLDIHVSAESALPKSKAARAQLATEMWSGGILTDPRKYVRLLDIPGTDFISEGMNRDAKQAHRENGKLRHGQQVIVHPFHNHMVHLEEHHNEMKELWYEEADEADPAKVAFDAHTAAHMDLALGQLGVPTPPGTNQTHDLVSGALGGGAPGGGPGANYLDPMTGRPSDPTRVAAGQEPSSLSRGPSDIRRAAGIGGAGQQGAVPGIPADQQAAQTGS